jgi:hypothetical protein
LFQRLLKRQLLRLQQHLLLLLVFLVRVTTRSQRAKAWAFLAQWQNRLETTHSLQAHGQASVLVVLVRLVPAAQVHVLVVLVRQVPVVRLVQDLAVVPVVPVVQVSAAVLRALVARQLVSVAHVHRAAQAPEVAVTVVEPPVRSVRAEAVVHQRPASRSVRNAKSLNREWLRASVAQLCHAATAQPSCVSVVVPASKTSQTRSRPLQLS